MVDIATLSLGDRRVPGIVRHVTDERTQKVSFGTYYIERF